MATILADKKRWAITILFALFAFFAKAQVSPYIFDGTIDKGAAVLYFNGIPTIIPDTTNSAFESEVAINTLDNEAYLFNRDSSRWYRMTGIAKSWSKPIVDPENREKLHLNLSNGVLKRWDGTAWVDVGGNDSSSNLEFQEFGDLNAGNQVSVTAFTLSSTINNIRVFRNGLIQRRDVDFSISGQNINFLIRDFQHGESVRVEN